MSQSSSGPTTLICTYISLIYCSGHKSAITCMKFDGAGTRLVSGSNDTNLIVWDLVSQTGLYR